MSVRILSPFHVLSVQEPSLFKKFFWKSYIRYYFQFSRSVIPNSLHRHGLQHARPPCPSPTPGVYSHSCPSTRWCLPATSSSVILFSSCLQPFPESGSFPFMSRFFASGGQSIGASASVLPLNIQDWSPLGWTGWISLQFKGLSRVFFNTTVQKEQTTQNKHSKKKKPNTKKRQVVCLKS